MSPPNATRRKKRATLLVADDDDLVRRCYARVLGHYFELVMVADGNAALQAVTRFAPAVALLDVQMPGLTGIQVAQRLLGTHDPPEIILVSGTFSEPECAERSSIPQGVLACLPKPLDFGLLMEWLERAMELRRARR